MSKKQTTAKKAIVKTIKPIEPETYNKKVDEVKESEFQGNEPIFLKPTLGSKSLKNNTLQDDFNDFLDQCGRESYKREAFEKAALSFFSGLKLSFRYPSSLQCFLSIEDVEYTPHIQLYVSYE